MVAELNFFCIRWLFESRECVRWFFWFSSPNIRSLIHSAFDFFPSSSSSVVVFPISMGEKTKRNCMYHFYSLYVIARMVCGVRTWKQSLEFAINFRDVKEANATDDGDSGCGGKNNCMYLNVCWRRGINTDMLFLVFVYLVRSSESEFVWLWCHRRFAFTQHMQHRLVKRFDLLLLLAAFIVSIEQDNVIVGIASKWSGWTSQKIKCVSK